MWDVYLHCQKWHQTPSQYLSWPCFANRLVAWKFDNAVLFLGITIENALQERNESGEGKSYRSTPRYTLRQLLEPDFRLPRPKEQGATVGPDGQRLGPLEAFVAQVRGMAGPLNPNVRLWEYVPPADEGEQPA